MTKNIVTASSPATSDTKTLRAFFEANPSLVPDGDKTVGKNSAGRGRVSAAAKTIFNERHPEAPYAEGKSTKATPSVMSLTYYHVQPSGRKVKKSVDLSYSEVRALVPDAPQRGKFSAETLEKAGEAYAAQVKANAPKRGGKAPEAPQETATETE